jgi:hypothetical protein
MGREGGGGGHLMSKSTAPLKSFSQAAHTALSAGLELAVCHSVDPPEMKLTSERKLREAQW